MIVCPNCNHQNPEGAVQCEACYTPLPATTTCPNCAATVQIDASFCGQCGFNLRAAGVTSAAPAAASMLATPDAMTAPVAPDLVPPPISALEEEPVAMAPVERSAEASLAAASLVEPGNIATSPDLAASAQAVAIAPQTHLQQQTARLLHVQTNTSVELPSGIAIVHIGKPNDRIPPDIDVSGFPNSEIVSRIHADIRLEGDAYYIEDVGSSNGTYINNLPLAIGNRHRLRPGDRVGLGKGDKVTFLFQVS
jgi:ribosomal protein L40E